jgi:hypothetical protein
VADAMEAFRQDVHQEPAVELTCCDCHELVPLGTLDPVVLVFERDARRVSCDQAAIGHGDAMRIAPEVRENGFGSAEWLNNRDSTRTANKKLGLQAIHLVPSSDSPPPGTMMCTCGQCVITEPQHGGYAERAAARSTTINQPTTNSLLTRKFTGNFKNPFMRNQGVSCRDYDGCPRFSKAKRPVRLLIALI